MDRRGQGTRKRTSYKGLIVSANKTSPVDIIYYIYLEVCTFITKLIIHFNFAQNLPKPWTVNWVTFL